MTYINKIQMEIDDIYDDFIFGRYENLFPIKAYMNIYNKIHINCDDKILFCYYRHYDRPCILAIDEKTATRIDKDGILSVCGDMGDLNDPETPIKFINKHSARLFMVADDTPIGYTQLLHFHEFGNNFSTQNLCDGRKYVVTSLEQIIKQVDLRENGPCQHPYKKEVDEYDSSYSLSKDEYNRRKKLIQQDFEIARRGLKPSDIEPKIEMTDDYCAIEWVECYNNHGLYRCKYQISRKDYSVSKISETPVLSVIPTFMY